MISDYTKYLSTLSILKSIDNSLAQPVSSAMIGSKISRGFLATNQKTKKKAVKFLEASLGCPSNYSKVHKSQNRDFSAAVSKNACIT